MSGIEAQTASTPTVMKKAPLWRSHFGRLITFAQIAIDFSTVFACYLGSFFFYTVYLSGWSPQTPKQFALLAAGAGLLYVIIMERVGLYRREISLLNVKELRGMFFVGLYAASIILSVLFYIRWTSFSRITFTSALVSTPIVLYLQRQLFYKIHLLFHQKGWSQKRVFIYGAGHIGTHLAKRLFQSPSLGMYPAGFLDDVESKYGTQIRMSGVGRNVTVPVLGGEEVLNRVKEFNVETVLIALPSASFERNRTLVEHCVANGVDYGVVPQAYEEFIERVELYEIGGIPILKRRVRSANFIYLILKRLTDFVLAAVFITLLSPMILIIGLAIKLESKGPTIFKQKRVGYRGKEFTFYKFRSMFTDAPKYARTPSDPNDARITKVGRWLRRTSLDELPQLFNVFRGDMSLVGPRPEMPFIVEKYTPFQRRRLEAKPGITGVWQISAVRGEPIHENIEYDLFYLENRTLLLDLAIIVKTILSVVRGIGAI